MKTSDNLSNTQFMILFWGALLCPMVESLLNIAPEYGGKGVYLTPFLLLPCFLLWGAIIAYCSGKQRGFAQALEEIHGKLWGKILLSLYFLWGIFLMAVQLRLCALGFLAVGYQEGSLLFLLPALAVFIWWMSGSSLSGFARSATFYFVILLLILAVVLGFSAKELRLERVLPLWTEDIAPITTATFPLLGLFGYGIYASFFLGEVNSDKNSKKAWIYWSLAACCLMSLFLFLTIGTFGVHLLLEMDDAFFQLAKGVAVEGGFQRMEGVVLALWTLADLILLGVLLRGTAQCGKQLIHWKQSPLIISAIILLSTFIALIYPDIHTVSEDFVLWGNLFFAWILPLFLLKKPLHFLKSYGIMKKPQ